MPSKQEKLFQILLERKQREDQTESQTLLHTMESTIDNLKMSLTEEVKRVLNHRVQSTTHELNELKQELKQVESHEADMATQLVTDSERSAADT